MSTPSTIKIHEHLFEIYPSMPKYAADPSQSDIIKTYDHLMLRFAGHYGRQPEYFVKAPLSAVLFGDPHSYVGLPVVTFNSSQSIIIAIAKSSSKKIRLNHYETTLFGELQLTTSVSTYQPTNLPQQSVQSFIPNYEMIKQQQQNLVMKILKVFTQTNSLMELQGMDLLVYKDFAEEKFMYSREAFVYGLYAAVHVCSLRRKVTLDDKVLHKAFQKVSDFSFTHVEGLPQLVNGSYGSLTISLSLTQKPKQVPFPEGHSLIIANTMTPQPKKLIRGKRFNLRECEVQIGIELILSELGITKEVRSIKALMETIECDSREMMETVESSIPAKGMSAEQIETILERPLADVLKHLPFAGSVIDENVEFHPQSRLKFFLEQQRLISALAEPGACLSDLLESSSRLARDLLCIDSQQIQEVLKIASQYGGGCKILGNGWGGCLAIVCKEQVVEDLYKQLVEEFYLAENNRVLLGDDVQVYLRIVGQPQMGVGILDPTNEIWFG